MVVLGALLIVAVARVLLVLFAGVLLALLFRAGAEGLSRLTRLPTRWTLTLIILTCVGSVVVASVQVAPTLDDQVTRLRRELPAAIARLRKQIPPELAPKEKGGIHAVAPQAQPPSGVLMSALGNSIEVLSGLIVVFFIALYGAAQPEQYVRACLALTPNRYRLRMRRMLQQVRHDLTRWLVGRLIAMTFVGVTTTIAFYILELPLALILGILAGLLTFIEYAGALVSAVPPVLLALAHSPMLALWVVVIYSVLHIIEGYVLTPLLARIAVHLPSAVTLATQVVFGFLLGPLGLTFSTPLLVLAISASKVWRHGDMPDQTAARA